MKKKTTFINRGLSMLLIGALSIGLTACGGSTAESAVPEKGNYSASGMVADEEAAAGGSYSEGGMLVAEAAAEEEVYYGGGEVFTDFNTEEYASLEEGGFKTVAISPLSTFSADVDTASYSNLRRMIESGYSLENIPRDAVRIEEMLNYFSYDYQDPREGEPFGITAAIADCPWNEDSKLMQLGLQTKEIDFSEAPDSNLVFLIDVSGSMNSEDKIGLLQRAFLLLTDELTAKDRVSIITYAGSERVILEGAKGNQKEKIKNALEGLFAYGSTNGGRAILRAYELAEKYYIEGGNNRIILATDGDLNVGITDESSLKELVEDKRESGINLSVLGFGSGNIKDNKMETLADNGNGNYAYIDSLNEAKKVLVEELGANLVTVAKDVKFQVEFNPEVVKGYRLLGYENRTLAAEDFTDDTKDAGEVGAGHSVTVLYEIVTVDSDMELDTPQLKYGSSSEEEEEQEIKAAKLQSVPEVTFENVEWLTVSVRYKEPEGSQSKLLSYPIDGSYYEEKMPEDMKFAAAVAEFGMVIRDSEYKGSSSFNSVLNLLDEVDLSKDEYREEFRYLVNALKRNS